jgi:predicted enzyme related to lactoylglutathione lyase
MTIPVRGIGQIAIFVDEPPESARFWAEALDAPQRLADGGALVDLGFVELYFHPVDGEKTPWGEEKNPWGGSTVVYLGVDDLAAAREQLLAAGCDPWRGPIEIEHGRHICQVRDPFGTIWGLDGR